MPEIAEGETTLDCLQISQDRWLTDFPVARLVHFLRQHLVGKTVAKVKAPDDINVFGKVGCSGPAFESALKGRTVSNGRNKLEAANPNTKSTQSRSRKLAVRANISGLSWTNLPTQ